MNDITFSGLDFANLEEIRQIARLHQSAPLENGWIEGYEVKEDAVEETYNVLANPENSAKTHVVVARDKEGDLAGFHWVSAEDEGGEASARIESLWVDQKHRRKGIARELKRLGEAWLRARGAKRITTGVFYVNKAMIELNLKEGFTPWQVQMTKEL